MSKIDIASVPVRNASVYPAPYNACVAGRHKQALAQAAGLTQFGVNLTRLKPGAASAQRHWHENEDEFVYILKGEAVLVDETGRHVLMAGEAAGFKAGVANGHHIVNESSRDVVLLEIGTRADNDTVTYADDNVDMMVRARAGKTEVLHRDGTPY